MPMQIMIKQLIKIVCFFTPCLVMAKTNHHAPTKLCEDIYTYKSRFLEAPLHRCLALKEYVMPNGELFYDVYFVDSYYPTKKIATAYIGYKKLSIPIPEIEGEIRKYNGNFILSRQPNESHNKNIFHSGYFSREITSSPNPMYFFVWFENVIWNPEINYFFVRANIDDKAIAKMRSSVLQQESENE